MSTHKRIDVICVVVLILSLLVTVLFMNGGALGLQAAESVMGYEQRLFSQDQVHTVDLVVEDWEGFLQTCTNEEYTLCNAVIDGEAFSGIGIRAKGNTSLSSVAAMDSNRYSFKLEFDQYDSTKSYYGLDKLSLNNLIQDNTMMKDYLTYQLMAQMGAPAPLCSYVYITVNGEDWGLYLAVEAVEESFLQRNYGSDYGELYKPDSMSNGGGRGNGKDFDMDKWNAEEETSDRGSRLPTGAELKQALEAQGIPAESLGDVDWETVTVEELSQKLSQLPGVDVQALFRAIMGAGMNRDPMGGGAGRGSAAVKLQYVDDDPASYEEIFGNAKTDITQEDQTRLIEALRRLTNGEDLENTVDMDSVLRYFVVHTFVCNDDSYTGTMIHNYYLYEKDGRLAMIPWDYNLAFGGFRSGNATSVINGSIDTLTSGNAADRPMFGWITSDEAYTRQYHQLYGEFLNLLDTQMVSKTAELIMPYVEKDPTKFCTAEQFQTGVAALEQFLQLRSESVRCQLAGQEGAVDASGLNLTDMGSMNQGVGGMEPPTGDTPQGGFNPDQSGGMEPPTGDTPQGGFAPDQPGGMELPTGDTPQGGFAPGQPGGMEPPTGDALQGGFRPGQMGDMQRPGNRPNQMGDMQRPDNRPNQMEQMSDPIETPTQPDLLPVLITLTCVILLAAAIALAVNFKRRK